MQDGLVRLRIMGAVQAQSAGVPCSAGPAETRLSEIRYIGGCDFPSRSPRRVCRVSAVFLLACPRIPQIAWDSARDARKTPQNTRRGIRPALRCGGFPPCVASRGRGQASAGRPHTRSGRSCRRSVMTFSGRLVSPGAPPHPSPRTQTVGQPSDAAGTMSFE